MLHLFSSLALGTRFNYIENDKVWVKISGTTIAEWDEGEKAST